MSNRECGLNPKFQTIIQCGQKPLSCKRSATH